MNERVEFKRNIGLFMAVMIGIGAMMGPGIFALPGKLAEMAGPLGIAIYVAMGMLAFFTALNYSELGAAVPRAGGGYSFISRTMNRTVSFYAGWFFWIGNTLACSMYALIFAYTIKEYFWPGANVALISFASTLIFMGVNFRGMANALKLITIMNLVELVVLVGIALLGLTDIEPPNLEPFAPMGLKPFLPGMALIYISYVGYELITVASEEIVAPSRTIPRAILVTLSTGIAVYALVVFVMMGTVHHTVLAETEVPFILTAQKLLGPWGRVAATVATVMASLSALGVTLGASGRILYALGRDGHFPSRLAKLHKRHQTPHLALAVCTIFVAVFSATGIVRFVASVADFGYLMAQGFVNYSVIALHRRMPNLRRPFKVALFPVVPILGAVFCWGFVPTLEKRSIVMGGVLALAGGIIYLLRPLNRRELANLPKTFSRYKLILEAKRRKRMRVLIISGQRLGRNIADRLLARDEHRLLFRSAEHQVTFIEEDDELCRMIEQRYNVPIFQGDGTKREILEQVGPENVDVVVAASEDDGKNVIAALQARRLGMPQVIAIVQEPDYIPLLEEKGIVAISAPWATAAMVENYLDRPGVADLFEIGTGVANLVGVIVPEDGGVVGREIRAIEMPHECVVAAVIRGKQFVVPRGETRIEAGDHVVFVGPMSAIKKAQDRFLLRK